MKPGSAVAIAVAAVAIGFAVFCLVNLSRSRVRGLPKWAWALIICVSIPWGGLVYLIIGRDPARPDAAAPAPPPVPPAPAAPPAQGAQGAPTASPPLSGAAAVPRRSPGAPVVIEVDRLTKRFGPVTAVDDLSFAVRPGTVTGFLGPNGAGKTTTLRVILGLDAPSSGAALVGGRRYQDFIRPLRQVGSLLDATALPSGRPAWFHLLAIAQSNGIGRRRVSEVLELTGLETVAGRRTGEFSLGMKQRLGIAAALLADPPVLLLDEPVNGLDPEGIHWIRELLRYMAAEGRTILVSSHLMSEMAQTADHLIIIGRGRLLADTPTAQFMSAAGHDVLVRSPRAGELAGLLTASGAVVTREDDGALAVTGMDQAAIGDLAVGHGIAVHELMARHASLEDAYLALTGDSTDYRAGAAGSPRSAPPGVPGAPAAPAGTAVR
jgi:ABC-2 type transport system ATP-binding protein